VDTPGGPQETAALPRPQQPQPAPPRPIPPAVPPAASAASLRCQIGQHHCRVGARLRPVHLPVDLRGGLGHRRCWLGCNGDDVPWWVLADVDPGDGHHERPLRSRGRPRQAVGKVGAGPRRGAETDRFPPPVRSEKMSYPTLTGCVTDAALQIRRGRFSTFARCHEAARAAGMPRAFSSRAIA
jgi:hypothetical protein